MHALCSPNETFNGYRPLGHDEKIDYNPFNVHHRIDQGIFGGIGSGGSRCVMAEAVSERLSEIMLVGRGDESFTGPLVHLVASATVAGGMAAGEFTIAMDGLNQRMKVSQGQNSELIFRALSVAILCQRQSQGRIRPRDIERMGSIYDLMCRRHWWITVAQDLPLAALIGMVNAPAEHIDADCERTFLALTNRGFQVGISVQVAASILSLLPTGQECALDRFLHLAQTFRSGRIDHQPRPAELSLLCLLDLDPADIASCYQTVFSQMKDSGSVEGLRSSDLLPVVALAFVELLPFDRSLVGMSNRAGQARQQTLHRDLLASICAVAIAVPEWHEHRDVVPAGT